MPEGSLRKISTEVEDFTYDIITEYITCPHCEDYIQPPCFCCENGHFVCFECKDQITKCPTCGTENYPNKSNSVFDMILKDIYYPCCYQKNGCPAFYKYKELKNHHLICEFKLERCTFHSEGCPVMLKVHEKATHELFCEYGVHCRIYSKIKNQLNMNCQWKGSKKKLLDHVAESHQLGWCPHQIESNTTLSLIIPLNFDFEKVELIYLKDINEMFYFYSRTIGNEQHFVAVQYIGNTITQNNKQFMYSVEFRYEHKKVRFDDLVLPYNMTNSEIYSSNHCFNIQYDFLKKYFLAEMVIDCNLKIYKQEKNPRVIKKYMSELDTTLKNKKEEGRNDKS